MHVRPVLLPEPNDIPCPRRHPRPIHISLSFRPPNPPLPPLTPPHQRPVPPSRRPTAQGTSSPRQRDEPPRGPARILANARSAHLHFPFEIRRPFPARAPARRRRRKITFRLHPQPRQQ